MFTGSIVALITPMNAQGNICRISLKKLIEYHVASSTAAIVSVGTTGESATLSYKEHGDVIMIALDLADGRIPIIAGTGANSTAEAISLTKRFRDTGIIGCLTVTPYYNCPTQEGIYQHFKSIAESTDLPQILYNVPSRTGCDMLPDTIARLSEMKNIIGIKEATGNLSRISQIQELVNDDFILISGDDATALDSMQLGSKGVISVTANIAAREMVEICALAQIGKFTEARFLNRRLMYLHQALFYEPNPIPVKWAAKKLGLITENILRLPMIPLTEAGQAKMTEALIQAGLQ